MRKDLYNILLCGSLLALAGCSSENTDIDTDDFYKEKHPIELNIGGEALASRVVTNGEGKTLNALPVGTCISMVMKSVYSELSDATLDYKGANKGKTLYTATTGTTEGTTTKENPVKFEYSNIRYWDDIHARSSQLSVWAIAVPGVSANNWKTASGWSETAIATNDLSWEIPSAQTTETVKQKDLCFSNNKATETDKMKFNVSDRKFDTGKLIFYHALSKITVNLVEDEGFDHSVTTDFNLDGDVTIKGNKLSGKFDVAQGEFTSLAETATATTMACVEKAEEGYTLEALVMPGNDLSTTLNDAITFSIDGNSFNVSNATLLAKLKESGAIGNDWTGMEAGKNYVFTFNIKMTDIKLTATVAGWNEVIAKDETPLINVPTSYGQTGNDFGKGFSFLRSTNINSGYSKDAEVSYADSKYTMTPQLYWPNHSTHYFFRGVWPSIGTDGTPTANVTGSSISVQNVKYAKDKYPSDLMLGYPRTTDDTCPHSNNVATNGICATEGDIRMNFQYVMSQVLVNLSTSVEGTADRVKFDSSTKVEIVGGYTDGTILLSNGSSTMGTKADYTMNREGSSNINYRDAILPQNVTALKFRITVTDTDGKQDKYETVFPISEIEVGPESGTKDTITAWEPGKKYIYNLYITKTGIKVTATIKDWIQATGSTTIWM